MSSSSHHVAVGSGRLSRALPAGRFFSLIIAIVAILASTGCAASSNNPAPGEYRVDVVFSGGSGRATVQSPAKLTVTPDSMIAEIVWSSPYYTWMEVGSTRYTPTSAQGEDAKFEIPVTLDTDIVVTAETTAMSAPREIEYTLRLDSATLKAA